MTAEDTTPRPVRGGSWWPPLALVALVVVAYAGTLRVPFVFDDHPAILENASIRHLGHIGDVLHPPAGGATTAGRPVLNLSLAVNHAISGTAPWSYHALNLLIHIAAALLVYGLVRRSAVAPAGKRADLPDWGCLAIAALWAVHPLQTEAVTYTVQRAESLMGLFYLLTLYAFARGAAATGPAMPRPGSAAPSGARWFLVAVGACALGMATKEVMATAPVMVLLYDRTFLAGSFRAALRRRSIWYGALAATWLLLGYLVLGSGGNRGGTVGFGVNVPWWAYPLTQFAAVARYLGLAGWPHPLVFEYGTHWVQRASDLLPYAPIVLALAFVTIVALRRWPVAGFLGAWFLLILAPSSLAPGIIQMTVEHRAYLSLLAVVAALVAGAKYLVGNRALPALALASVALTALTVRRNHDYRSPLALWTDTVAKRPDNPRARAGRAAALEALGRLDDAIAEWREIVRLQPDEAQYHYNLALDLARAGRGKEAIQQYEVALQLNPADPRAHNNLAGLLVAAGRLPAALAHFEAAERLRPDDAMAHYNHALALADAGRDDDAIREFQAALALRPDFGDAHLNLATALMRAGRPAEALAQGARAVALSPGDGAAHAAFGRALLETGRADEAETQFRAALAATPDEPDACAGLAQLAARNGRGTDAAEWLAKAVRAAPARADLRLAYGNALVNEGNIDAAASQYEAGIRLDPNDADAHHNLGSAYARLGRYRSAEAEFAQAVRLQPHFDAARRHLEQVRRILGEQ